MAFIVHAHTIPRRQDVITSLDESRGEARRLARVLEADVRPMYLEANRTPFDLRPWVR